MEKENELSRRILGPTSLYLGQAQLSLNFMNNALINDDAWA